jgi:hypothetical protein
VVALVVAVISLRCLLAREWARGAANAGVEVIGAVAIGTAAIGMVEIGMAAIGMVVIGMAATTGMAIGGIAIMSSSSVTSVFRGGGAGAIHTDTMIMVTRTAVMGMGVTVLGMGVTVLATDTEPTDTATAATATVMGTAIAADTATAVGPEWPSYSAGSRAPVITAGPLTACWDRRRVEQFGPTSVIAGMKVDAVSSGDR